MFYSLDVCLETLKYVKANPVRSSIYAGIGSFAYGCYKTNPTYRTFTDQLKVAQNQIALVYEDSQNPDSVSYLKSIEKNRNTDTLRVLSLGVFSVLWIDDFASELATADATCKYLEPAYATFHERIIDWGFFGKWWNIEKSMKDYDVNL